MSNIFQQVKEQIIGEGHFVTTPYGRKKLLYADWIASGRMYRPIEEIMTNKIGPMVANTHSESSDTGKAMTYAYHEAQAIIKNHVNAGENDVLLCTGTGMTGALSKLMRMLGLKLPEWAQKKITLTGKDKPVVFVTHMEHHSNQISWLEAQVDLVVIPPDEDLLVNPKMLEAEIAKYADRDMKIGSFSACSNVSGIKTPYHELAKIMHQHGGICLVDFAASAPYVEMDMHPKDPAGQLDAIFFSPHKFLGGPGSSGVLIFDKDLYKNSVPDEPGGGTVEWTDPWGGRSYFDDIELREDGGTPGFLQSMRIALSIKLKEQMGVENIHAQEQKMVRRFMDRLEKIASIRILAGETRDRIGAVSFYAEHIHFNLVVKLLNDRFGIQMRGGCSCAGTYGHYLLNVDQEYSKKLTGRINEGDLSQKPGWIRASLHYTNSIEEVDFMIDAIQDIVSNIDEWRKDYDYDSKTNEFINKNELSPETTIREWFVMS